MINLMLSFIVLLSLSHTKLHQCVQCRCCCCNIFEAVLSIVLLSLFHTKLHQCAFVIVVVLAIDLKRMFALSNFTLTLSHWAATACVVVVTTDLKLMSALIYSSLSLSLNYVSMCALTYVHTSLTLRALSESIFGFVFALSDRQRLHERGRRV